MSVSLSWDQKYDRIIEYFFRVCAGMAQKNGCMPTDMKNIVIKYLDNKYINFFTDNCTNFYFNLYDNKDPASCYQLFPSETVNNKIQFCDLHGKPLFVINLGDMNHCVTKTKSSTSRNICHTFLSASDDIQSRCIKIFKKIIASNEFKQLCTNYDIQYETQTVGSRLKSFGIGFSKFPKELTLLLYQQFNELYRYINDDPCATSTIRLIRKSKTNLSFPQSEMKKKNVVVSNFIASNLKLDHKLTRQVNIIDLTKCGIQGSNMKSRYGKSS